MTTHIGRLNGIGVGKESTSGTPVAVTDWIPATTNDFNIAYEYIEDDSAIGRIEDASGDELIKKMTNAQIDGIARNDFIGHILMAAMGTSAAPTLTEIGVYKHAFTLLNTNNHPSYTMVYDNPVGEQQASYMMLGSLGLTYQAGDYVRFTSSWMGKTATSTSGNTPAYSNEEIFLASNATITYADDLAALDTTPTTLTLTNFSLNIEKNLTDYMAIGDSDINSLHNQQFSLSGTLEAKYDSATLEGLVSGATKKAMRIKVLTKAVIGATEFGYLEINLPSVSFRTHTKSTDLNGIVTQTVELRPIYSFDDSQAININLQNTVATQY